MQNRTTDNRPHLILANTATAQAFTTPKPPPITPPPLPARNRQQHGAALQTQLSAVQLAALHAAQLQNQHQLESGIGLQIEFSGFPDIALAFASLHNEVQKIELLSLRQDGNVTHANVFVPDGKLAHFEKVLNEYVNEHKTNAGKVRDHKALVNTIAAIGVASLRALWTDDVDQLPQDQNQPFWWEVWLPVRGKRDAVVADFKKLVTLVGCEVSERQANFPERTVLWMFGSQAQLQNSVAALNCVAELRRAKDTAEFFDGMKPVEQVAWVDDAVSRLQDLAQENAPRICLIDSGVNRAHPLLERFIGQHDLYTINPNFGVNDVVNHGTGLAGLALYGDLTEVLSGSDPIEIAHRLESVKIVTGQTDNNGDAHSHAALFGDAVSQAEVVQPEVVRVFATAVTATDYRDQGQPSSWSATVDSLAADANGEGQFPRLFILAAGNMVDGNAWAQYPASLSTNLIHDPGQAWNALTVGALTDKIDTEDPALQAIACSGGISPFSSTSATWEAVWPLKPDVVMEGGNVAIDASGFAAGHPSLNLLTTNNTPSERLFTTSNATSAASALCARLAAQIMLVYPALHPETVRALIVHSAEWTTSMRDVYLNSQTVRKKDIVNLIRHCGWGAPNVNRALYSAGNSLTLLVEDQIFPFKKENGKVGTRDMNLHALPWPKQALLALGEVRVQMRVTLSYFIEPNPSARGVASKFHYPSHRLRFEVQRPLETSSAFQTRINAAALHDENDDSTSPSDDDWLLGKSNRYRGSLHQDEWSGTAAELANRGHIAVFPAMGWWRTRAALKKYNSPARYSLLVSIRTEQTETDLYALIEQLIAQRIAPATTIEI